MLCNGTYWNPYWVVEAHLAIERRHQQSLVVLERAQERARPVHRECLAQRPHTLHNLEKKSYAQSNVASTQVQGLWGDRQWWYMIPVVLNNPKTANTLGVTR